MTVLSMSKQEFNRLDVLLRVLSGRLRAEDACGLLGLRRRQVFRLLRDFRQGSATSLLSKAGGGIAWVNSCRSMVLNMPWLET